MPLTHRLLSCRWSDVTVATLNEAEAAAAVNRRAACSTSRCRLRSGAVGPARAQLARLCGSTLRLMYARRRLDSRSMAA